MDPLTLIGLAAAAGFGFKRFFKSSSGEGPNSSSSSELSYGYSHDVIANPRQKSKISVPDLEQIDVIDEYKIVRGLVEVGFPFIFVTGGAGTGKSTFVKWIQREFKGRCLLGAPTGMAAINIGGKTLHSLCQLPPAWILKKDIKSTPRRKEIKEAKILIIDEVSMVTANLLDGVSAFFRKNKGVDKPFGGLSVIFVGDLFQLPPVVNGSTKHLFKQHYGSPKFYNAKSMANNTFYGVELKRAFRQIEQDYVDLMARIREGYGLEEALNELNCSCNITDQPPSFSVWLSPRNSEVDIRNQIELEKLETQPKLYRGKIIGNFNEDRLPSPIDLVLKVGAQVMFTKNDPSKRWVNGTVGSVIALEKEKIYVEVESTGIRVDVDPVEWEDFEYKWNSETKEIERFAIGRYQQFPLVLGWALTIHKSQGKTIEKVHLDLGAGAFETGQTYVALSRCRTLAGLSFSRPISRSDISVDGEARYFYRNLREMIDKLPPKEMMRKLQIDKQVD